MNVKLFVCVLKLYSVKTDRKRRQLHTFLITTLDGGEWSVSCILCITPQNRPFNTRRMGALVSCRAGLDDAEKRIFFFFCIER